MSDIDIIPVKPEIAAKALVTKAGYEEMVLRASAEPDAFWAKECQRLDWIKPPRKIKNTSFTGDVSIKWFEDGTLNASANCLDRHLAERGDQVALIWEGDDPQDSRRITYAEAHAETCRMANVLKAHGVKKGDRVPLYLPMIPEAAYAILACARIGAVHSVIFAGFSPDSIAGRIQDCNSRLVITADEGLRGGKTIALKA